MHIRISLETVLVRVGQDTEYRPGWNGVNTTEGYFSLTEQLRVDVPGWDLDGGCLHSFHSFRNLDQGCHSHLQHVALRLHLCSHSVAQNGITKHTKL